MSCSVISRHPLTCVMPAFAIMTDNGPRALTDLSTRDSTSWRRETSATIPIALRPSVVSSWTTCLKVRCGCSRWLGNKIISRLRTWSMPWALASMSLMQMSKPSFARRKAMPLPLFSLSACSAWKLDGKTKSLHAAAWASDNGCFPLLIFGIFSHFRNLGIRAWGWLTDLWRIGLKPWSLSIAVSCSSWLVIMTLYCGLFGWWKVSRTTIFYSFLFSLRGADLPFTYES